jgi:hypothetical protein
MAGGFLGFWAIGVSTVGCGCDDDEFLVRAMPLVMADDQCRKIGLIVEPEG